MSTIICVMGESGAGKTTSMRNLDPGTTYYIDCDKKGLSWKGWRNQYNSQNKNYYKTDDQHTVLKLLRNINTNESAKHITTIIIDTINGIMVADEMRRSKEKGYDKWIDLACSIYDIIDYALVMRDDLTVIFVAHTQTERDDSGFYFTRIKTSGKKLDKITLESKFPVVLHAKIIDGKHVFETKANNSTAKTPYGAFDDATIDNDISFVMDTIKDF
ncbi:MAG: AAA family ATPase [Oscillospiraceae bacterium]|nr:AAA family ATPase [Oscillospiraceae bacterium]